MTQAQNGALEYLDCEGCVGVDTTALTALAQHCAVTLGTLDCDNCGDSVNDTGLGAVVGVATQAIPTATEFRGCL